VSHKGFLPGPYDHRTALDEVVQMMGGLAYMTGRPGDPLRAGASVNDIMGGMFGAIGAMAALALRERTGEGQEVQSALFENNVFLVAQHMLQYAVTGKPAAPMPARISAWAVYDVFQARGGDQIFLAVVSDTQWAIFCEAFGYADLKGDTRLKTNNDRVRAREWLIPLLRERIAQLGVEELVEKFEANGLPFAPITKPEELLDDPHLLATGGLAPITLPDGRESKTVLLPLTWTASVPACGSTRRSWASMGRELLAELGYSEPYKSLAELIAAAKARPGEIKQALAGTGTLGHMAGEVLAQRAGFKVLNVPYKGAAPAITDLLGGQTDCMFATPQGALAMVKGGKLRALAVTSAKRLPVMPEVPTVAESYKGFEAVDWKALVVPAGTSPDIVKKLNAAVDKALAKPATISQLLAEGSTPVGGSPEQAAQYIKSEHARWGAAVRSAGVRPE
jgi:hypothetical protein